MTSSAGASGLIFVGSPPRSAIASRMVARSTTHGTPVKSCMITRAGVNWISVSGSASGVPAGERADVVGGDVRAVLGAQQVLQQDLQAVRQRFDVEAVALDRVEAVDLVGRAADVQACPWLRSCPVDLLGWPWFSSGLRVVPVSVPHLAHAHAGREGQGTLSQSILMSRDYHAGGPPSRVSEAAGRPARPARAAGRTGATPRR